MGTLTTGEVRFSFVNVFTPRAVNEGQQEKYSITILIPKSDTVAKQKIDMAMNQAVQDGLSKVFGGQMPARIDRPIHDGDGVRPGGEPFGEECKGHWVMTASSLQQPEVVDGNLNAILSPTEVYSGCYGRVSLRFYAYNKNGKKGVGCGLGNVQKLRDGEPLSGRTSAADDFGGNNTVPGVPVDTPFGTGMEIPFGGMHAPTVPQYNAVPHHQAPMGQIPVGQVPMPQGAVDPITGAPVYGGVMGV